MSAPRRDDTEWCFPSATDSLTELGVDRSLARGRGSSCGLSAEVRSSPGGFAHRFLSMYILVTFRFPVLQELWS